MTRTCAHWVAALTIMTAALGATAQQVVDANYQPRVAQASYGSAQGPLVCIDGGHHNFHNIDGSFEPFGKLLRADGYVTRALSGSFGAAAVGRTLQGCAILVIANAQPTAEPWDSYPYPTPTAFTADETATLKAWVQAGGALLLIADHMPLAGAAAALAGAFGFGFNDGFAARDFQTEAEGQAAFAAPQMFERQNSTLREHPATSGRTPADRVERIRAFIGQAITLPAQARALLVLPEDFISLMPRKAWQFTLSTPKVAVGGWAQAGTLELGRGRVAAFGEAGMFTAQFTGPDRKPMGLNAPGAEQNPTFILNLMRWLAGSGVTTP